MKYIFVIALCITLLLWWCSLEKEEILNSEVDNNNEAKNFNWNEKNELWVVFMSWDVSFSYINQERIMWEIQYPEQKDMIVLEWYGKGIIQSEKQYQIPWLYGSVNLSGFALNYQTIFSFNWLDNNSERNYRRSYVWEDKEYREEFMTTNPNTHEYMWMLAYPKKSIINQNPHLSDIEKFCMRHEDMYTTIINKEQIQIWSWKLYILYRDNWWENNKISNLCFEKNDIWFELQRTANDYKKDIVDSIQFL